MSTWRRKVLELFYDIRHTFTGKDDTIYTLLVQLRSRVEGAHLKKDTDELDKIYGYVEWCFNQRNRVRLVRVWKIKAKMPLIPPGIASFHLRIR